jgi:hypothetical protein
VLTQEWALSIHAYYPEAGTCPGYYGNNMVRDIFGPHIASTGDLIWCFGMAHNNIMCS